jgi:hypothetical protein
MKTLELFWLAQGGLEKAAGFPEFEFFPDFYVAWKNRMVFSSNGYDVFPRILILEIKSIE